MVEKFEEGKIYVTHACRKPYGVIVEAATYNESGLMLDFYTFDRIDGLTQGRIYETGGGLESPENYNPKDFKEIGTVDIEYVAGTTILMEVKPSYTELENALKKIANAKNHDFRNWHQRGDYMQEIARKALRLEK